MLKKILEIVVAVILAGYIVWSVACGHAGSGERVCKGIELKERDSLRLSLVSVESVTAILNFAGLNPKDKNVESIDLAKTEEILCSHPLVEKAECYITNADNMRIVVESRVPIARVMSSYGLDCLLGSHGEIIEGAECSLHLPVASGWITREFASRSLPGIVKAINDDDFWTAQVEQIYVTEKGEVRLVPRVGGHLLILGTADDTADKLQRLRNFYDKGLDRIGWNKYSMVSVAYEGQVVCKNR